LPFKKYLERLPKDKKIILDFSEAVFIDHTCIEHLHNLQNLYIKNGGKFEITGMENLASLSDSPLSAKVATERHKIAKLAKRQEMLLQVAQQNDYTFSPQKILFDSKLKNLPFFFYRHLRYEENVLHKHSNKVHLQVSDIKAREGSQISLRFYHFTGLLITDIPKKLPVFYLEKESLVHRMLDSSGFRDINFEEHKQFSDNFFLQGTNELEIREFFTVELMNILMQNPDFHIESDGESLFIFHGEMELLEELETHKLVQLGETLVQYLTIKKKQVA
jgi:hypothetical protein